MHTLHQSIRSRVLQALHEADAPLSYAELHARLPDLCRFQVTRTVASLTKLGLIERVLEGLVPHFLLTGRDPRQTTRDHNTAPLGPGSKGGRTLQSRRYELRKGGDNAKP